MTSRAGVLLVVIAIVTTACAATRTTWAAVPVAPIPAADTVLPTYNTLHGVACPTAELCMVTGSETTATWDGSAWTDIPTPDGWRAGYDGAPDVACASPQWCIATLVDVNATWVWSGGAWTKVGAAPASDVVEISCPVAGDCVAVGRYSERKAFRWRDGAWTNIDPGPSFPSLLAISCRSTTWCMAVGGNGGGPDDPFAATLRWDGAAWHDEPLPAGADASELLDVDCTSTTSCVAVGNNGQPPINIDTDARAYRWVGAAWVDTDVSPLDAARLTAVSCATADQCVVSGVGGYIDPSTYAQPLSGVLAGGRWQARASAVRLGAIECLTTSTCIAVGGVGEIGTPVVQRWDGSAWRDLPGYPFPTEAVGTRLTNVSCVSATVCTAVGSEVPSPTSNGIIGFAERFAGGGGTPASDADMRGPVRFSGISCAGPNWCVAVGGSGQYASTPTIRTFDGISWSSVDLSGLPPTESPSPLLDVSCPTTTFCLAVGSFLALRYDGARWHQIAMPAEFLANTSLSVSCPAADRCTVADMYEGSTIFSRIHRWDGARWTRVYGSEPGSANPDGLIGVLDLSCSAPTVCVAVGSRVISGGRAPVVLRGDGSTWTTETLPTGTPNSYPIAVSCATDGSCVALGGTSSEPATDLFVSKPGKAWARGTAPPALGLRSLSCVLGSCLAVGGTSGSSGRSEPAAATLTY